MLEYLKNVTFCKDAQFTVPTFAVPAGRLDFFFKFPIPKPNKDRVIVDRDELGRIITARVPGIVVPNAVVD